MRLFLCICCDVLSSHIWLIFGVHHLHHLLHGKTTRKLDCTTVNDDTKLLEKIRMHLPEWNVSRIAERTGEAAAGVLESTDYLKESVRMIEREREYLTQKLRELGVKVYHSDTNYLLLKSAPGLYEKLLERGILIRRCANFNGLDDSYFRIAIRKHNENEELINILGKVL